MPKKGGLGQYADLRGVGVGGGGGLGKKEEVRQVDTPMLTMFGRCSSEPAELVPLLYSRGISARYPKKLHDFSVTIPRMSMLTASFLVQIDSGILCL